VVEQGQEVIIAFPGQNYENIQQLKLFVRVWITMNSERPDAVAICGYSTIDSFALLLWCKVHRVPAILMFETCVYDKPRNFIIGLIKKYLVRRFDAAICGGRRHQWYLKEMGFLGEKIEIGYDVVDNAHFSHPQNPSDDRHERVMGTTGTRYDGTFLASSRFVARKNIQGLVKAYKLYAASNAKPWRLVILGDGPMLRQIEKEAAGLLGENIQIEGFRQYEELPVYYASASVFVHPAHREAWGLVINEAIAAGLPVLIGRCVGCLGDLVVDGLNGFSFDSEDIHELAGLMDRMSSLPACDMANLSRWSRALSSGVDVGSFGLAMEKVLTHAETRNRVLLHQEPKRIDAFGKVRVWIPKQMMAIGRAVRFRHKWRRALRRADIAEREEIRGPGPLETGRYAFIVGAGRSGTTILGTLLGKHEQVRYLFEPYHLWAAIRPELDLTNMFSNVAARYSMSASDCTAVDKIRFSALFDGRASRGAHSVVVEKMPHNAVRLNYLGAIAEGVKIIHIVRDGCEVANSIDRISRYGDYNIWGLKHYHQWWGVDYSKWHAILRDVEKFGLSVEEVGGLTTDMQRGAVEWLMSCLAVRDYEEAHDDCVLEIRYQELVRSPKAVLGDVAEFLGVPADEDWLDDSASEIRNFSRSGLHVLALPTGLREAFNSIQTEFRFLGRAV